jgi:Asp-tRNA(Asn)/Glu-tRNA(Gln) amidotransferase A subunit family amidase
VPLSIKSSVAVEGLPWETGSRWRAGVRGDRDATIVRRLRAAGAIVLGVTNVAEQLMAWETDNALYGRTNSPWDLARTPGGSSGGESAAIAAGPLGGRHRQRRRRVDPRPRAVHGHLRPEADAGPRLGRRALPALRRAVRADGVVGPMASTVDDTWLLLQVDGRRDTATRTATPCRSATSTRSTPPASRRSRGWPAPVGAAPARPLRIGWFEDDGRTPVVDDCARGRRQAAQALAEAGYDVVPFRPEGLEEARTLWWEIFGRASRLLLEPLVDGREARGAPEPAAVPRVDAAVAEAHGGAPARGRDRARPAAGARARADAGRAGAALPGRAVTAFRHGEREWRSTAAACTTSTPGAIRPGSTCLQNPAVSVPAGLTASGLPVGVQVVAPPWEEHLALAVARVIERNVGGFRPPLRRSG